MEAIASRVETIASRVETIASRVETIASRVETIASRVEAIATRLEAIASRLDIIALTEQHVAATVATPYGTAEALKDTTLHLIERDVFNPWDGADLPRSPLQRQRRVWSRSWRGNEDGL